MDHKEVLLSAHCRSGNECHVTLGVERAREVRLSFRWTRRPSPDDREEWLDTIFPAAADRVRDYAFEMKTALEVVRDLEASGEIRRVGVDENGDWEFEGTGQGPGAEEVVH
jgi:hypothetical protein